MNTYAKFCPNVFVAKCTEEHQKGETIILTTQYGKEHECIVFNLVGSKDGFFFYSIVRSDGFNTQEYAKKKAERYLNWANSADDRSNKLWEASNEGRDFLSLGEPIKVGHHSEKMHRALIQRNHDRMSKAVEEGKKVAQHESKADYWNSRANVINLSMPESVEFFEFKLEEAKERHEGIKSGKYPKEHSFTLTYAKKRVNEMENNYKLAQKLWA